MPLRRFLVVLCLLCWPFMAGARTATLAATTAELPLVPWASIVKDADGTLRTDDLLESPAAAGTHMQTTMASFGFSSAAYWFSVELENRESVPLQRLLVFEPSWLDDVRVTLVAPDGTRHDYVGGDRQSFAHRTISHRLINFDLSLPPGTSRLLVRTQTRDPYLVGMTLWQHDTFGQAEAGDAGYFGLFYGAMGALLLYNLVLFLSTRETVYAAYVAYVAAFLAAHAAYNGHLFRLLWPESPEWGNWAHSIFIYLYLMSGVYFAIHFLELRARLPRAHRWAMAGLAALAASFVASAALGGYHWHVATSILWVNAYSPFVMLLGIWSLRSGNRAARYFLIATTAGLVGTLFTGAAVTGLVPYSFYAYHAADIGLLIDAILLSLALADRLRISRAEADLAKSQLIRAGRIHARELEETVALRTQELSQANAIKDKFFAIVAHDLRGPIGSLAVLFNEAVTSRDDVTDDLLEMVRATTQSTREFLEELLTWARNQRGEIECHPAAFDMKPVLTEVGNIFAAQAGAKGVRLSVAAEECRVMADLAMTRTILRNLTHNALKFTDSGGSIAIGASRVGDHCLVTVTDTGIGMSPATVQNLFRLDVKHHSLPGTGCEVGTGLGLILCKEFAEKNGGVIEVDSAPGKGSTFRVTLPLAAAHGVTDLDDVLDQSKSLKVLLVEDDPLHREASARILQQLGLEPAFAADGAEAIRMAAEHDYDVILMDIDMPKVDGIEAARRIRAAGSHSRIVSLSSYSRRELSERAGEVSFDGCLYKPLARDALVMLLAYSADCR